jgi:hypothetical protein
VGDNLGLQKIREQNFSLSMQNPVHNTLFIKVTALKPLDLAVQISNPQGQLLFSNSYPIEESTTSIQIPFTKFPEGVYLMQVGEDQNPFSVWKIIKN